MLMLASDESVPLGALSSGSLATDLSITYQAHAFAPSEARYPSVPGRLV